MSLSQNDSGRALEYGIAVSFNRLLPATIQDSPAIRKAKQCFELSEEKEQKNIALAAHEIAAFLIAHDKRLSDTGCTVMVQSDQKGQVGDVRDVIIKNPAKIEEVGISVKHRHAAVKHSRLSEKINFGNDWLGLPNTEEYFNIIAPIFQELRIRKGNNELWKDIINKKQLFYLPLLQAFQKEMQLLFNLYPDKAPKALVQYLLGRYDYYKVIKENGTISAMSFNINGTLKWGSKMPLPTQITAIALKPNSDTTLFMTFDKGWQLSFRIHNASSRVEPSLKFDINIIGMPRTISRHQINYHD